MIKFIIKRVIKNYHEVNNGDVRKAYGILSGVIGIICNIILFVIKLAAGIVMNSIAVISDAFNNLTDSGSSVITIIGANLSNKPPDEEHPYGHGRIEYIASLIVSFIIFGVGIELVRNSFKKVLHPEQIELDLLALIILGISILIKIWMYSYSKYIGRFINSSMNMATAKDSLNDAIATTGIAAGMIFGTYVDFPVDGILGLLISLLIIYNGFTTARDSVHFLLGPSPDPKLLEDIESIVSENGLLYNVHDVKIHDYGPGRLIASMHVDVPADMTVEDAHRIVHETEQRIKKQLGIDIVIHVDPSKEISRRKNKM